MAYNVKVLKYPLGYQVRLYSVPVDNPQEGLAAPALDDMFYNADTRQWESVPVVALEDDKLLNPFTGDFERVRSEMDVERSLRVSMHRTINRLYYLARSNYWDWFVTLTFSSGKVDRYDFGVCAKHLSKWLNNCKRKCPDMGYLVVPEQHKDGAWHFHGLFNNCADLGFVDSGKRAKGGQVVYNIGAYNLGFTTATRVDDLERVSKYICKYVTKDLCLVTFGRKRYWASKGLAEAETVEMLLAVEDKQRFLMQITDFVKHVKRDKGVFVNTDYLELEPGIDIDGL